MGFNWWGEGPTIQPRQRVRVRDIIARLQGERRREHLDAEDARRLEPFAGRRGD